jgi:hypothetical protein
MQLIKLGSSGDFVAQWQNFLRGQGYSIEVIGVFDQPTFLATQAFQRKYKLDVDGLVGNQTLGKAGLLGLELVNFASSQTDFPAKPSFPPLSGNSDRQALFGPLEFAPAPTSKNAEAIQIINRWDRDNILRVVIPQLIGIPGANSAGHVWFHKKAAAQLIALWAEWESQNLLNHVLSYSGDFVPRFVRGLAHKQVLSNHAFGTAFDINYAWNKLGTEPAGRLMKGCVYPLVPLAHKHGFYWGGHFSRKDGMHFEVATIIP